jgi:hypothetical protein
MNSGIAITVLKPLRRSCSPKKIRGIPPPDRRSRRGFDSSLVILTFDARERDREPLWNAVWTDGEFIA